MEITIRDLWNVLKKSFILVLVCAIVFGGVAYIYTANFVQKVYTSSTDYVLLVKNTEDSNMSVEKLNNALVVGGKSIMTLSSYLMTESTMKSVLKYIADMQVLYPDDPNYRLDHEYTERQLLGLFSFQKPEEETDLVFGVSCRAYSANDARVLLSAFSAIINERSASVLNGVFVIAECDPPRDGVKTAPHASRTALIAAVVGAAIPYLIFLIAKILDSRIKKEEDLKSNFDYPLLGQIPHF